jgi:hypothetical protein
MQRVSLAIMSFIVIGALVAPPSTHVDTSAP